jgi:hypothetical protein
MRITKEVLKKIASRVRREIKEEVSAGQFQPLIFFYDNRLKSMVELYLHSSSDKNEKDVIRSLKRLRSDISPAVVAVAYHGELFESETRKETEAIQRIPDHPKRFKIVIIEASSQTSHYEVMIKIKKKNDAIVFGNRYETVPGEGCVYTRNLWSRAKNKALNRSGHPLTFEEHERAMARSGRRSRIDWDSVLGNLAELEEQYGTPLAG